MTHQINNDAAKIELSIDQLDEVAGGNWLGDIGRWITHEIKAIAQNPVVAYIAAGAIIIGGAVSAGTAHKLN